MGFANYTSIMRETESVFLYKREGYKVKRCFTSLISSQFLISPFTIEELCRQRASEPDFWCLVRSRQALKCTSLTSPLSGSIQTFCYSLISITIIDMFFVFFIICIVFPFNSIWNDILWNHFDAHNTFHTTCTVFCGWIVFFVWTFRRDSEW